MATTFKRMGTKRFLDRKGLKAYDDNANEYSRNLATLALFKGDEGAEIEVSFILRTVKNGNKTIR